MNIRKGFFRLTLVLSFLCGILTLIFSDDIFRDTSLGVRSRDIKVTIPLPNDWQNRTLQEKLNSIDEVLIRLVDLENKTFEEERKESEEWAKFSAEHGPFMTIGERKKAVEKENEMRKKVGLKSLPPLEPLPHSTIGLLPSKYSDLTSREQQNVIRRLKEQIISDEKKLPRDRERPNYYVSSGPDWRELSFPIFIGFTIGFVPVWIIYAFIRWVVIGFIVGGFGGKSLKGGEEG